MAVPKKKTAKSASKTRYTHYKKQQQQKIADRVSLVRCQHCGELRQSHTVCVSCGMYKERQVVLQKEAPAEKTRIQA